MSPEAPQLKSNYVPPTPLSAARMLEALRAAAVSHVIVVPDTYQKTFLAAVAAASDLSMISACTEDEAVAINAGLYATGHRPILSVQNNGIYACINTLRGIALDGAVPTVMLIGQYGQTADVAPEASPQRMAHARTDADHLEHPHTPALVECRFDASAGRLRGGAGPTWARRSRHPDSDRRVRCCDAAS